MTAYGIKPIFSRRTQRKFIHSIFFGAKFASHIFLYYLCNALKVHEGFFKDSYRGVEQLVARRAHNPKVVRFKSHPRYYMQTANC